MKDPMYTLEQLGRRARMESSPRMDVSRRVLRTLRQVEPATEKPMLIFAVCSAAAASFALGYCVYLYYLLNDPLSGFFQTMPGITS